LRARKKKGLVLALALAFAVWQMLLFAKGYHGGEGALPLLRLIDPVFLSGVLYWGMDHKNDDLLGFGKSVLPCLSLNTAVQVWAIALPSTVASLVSLAAPFALAYCILRAHRAASYRLSIRPGILATLWALSTLTLLPFPRLACFVYLAYMVVLHHRSVVRTLRSRVEMDLQDQKVMQGMIAKITDTVQDFANMQSSLAHFMASLCQCIEGKSAAVYVWDSEKECYYCAAIHGIYFPLAKGDLSVFTKPDILREAGLRQVVSSPESLVWECGAEKQEIFLPYAAQDERVQAFSGKPALVRSLILEPLVLDRKLLGVLVVENKVYEQHFTASDHNLVRNFSYHATMILNTSRMAKERGESERMATELALGTKIQADLLPESIPQVDGLSLTASMRPAKEIGGDYYDFIPGGGHRMGIVIGDVSGKGVPAGMVMTILQTMLQASYRHASCPRSLLVEANALLAQKIKSSMFMTLLFFEWDTQKKTLRYASCGHEHILWYKKAEGALECRKSGGIALAMTDDIEPFVKEIELPVQEGDTVFVYTDGVTEAKSPSGEMFGLERLRNFVANNHNDSIDEIRQNLMIALDDWRGSAEQSDDITLLGMRIEG
jgi:serine phosphatase RsbU (regulator of sigma subunit)